MLLSLSIQNLILIDSLSINFNKGLSAFTGETGAGKSIILDALLYTLGERTNSKLMKDPARSATVIATFSSIKDSVTNILSELGIDNNDDLILRRVIQPDGKSKSYINDVPVGVNSLQKLASVLLEICGQHDSKGLMDQSTHIDILDDFADVDQPQLAMAYINFTKLKNDLSLLKSKLEKAEIERTYLASVIEELEALNPQQNEEETLAEKRKFLSESSKVSEILNHSIDRLSNSKLLSDMYAMQRDLEKYEDFFSQPLKSLNAALIELNETADNLQEIARKSDFDSATLEDIESRLFQLRSTARKYHTLPSSLPEFLEAKKADLALIENSSEAVANLEKMLNSSRNTYLKLSEETSNQRLRFAEKLEKSVNSELKNLKMDKATFKIEISKDSAEERWTAKGFNNIHFLIQTNPGQPFSNLSKTASGGELSRIMLAIKVVLTGSKSIPTIIFDEIDTGISGAVSDAVGQKLSQLAQNSQVLIVTHQPQVAAYANNHFLVYKESNKSSTNVGVKTLDVTEKQAEIARMLSGQELTKESLAAAKKLIQAAA